VWKRAGDETQSMELVVFLCYLSDEVADDAAVVDAHARPVGVEDPSDPNLHARADRTKG
jgi:hypothetical protein